MAEEYSESEKEALTHIAVALVAQSCPLMSLTDRNYLIYVLGEGFNADELESDFFNSTIQIVRAKRSKVGSVEFCKSAWEDYGPDGAVVPYLLN